MNVMYRKITGELKVSAKRVDNLSLVEFTFSRVFSYKTIVPPLSTGRILMISGELCLNRSINFDSCCNYCYYCYYSRQIRELTIA